LNPSCPILLIERLTDERLDHGLTAEFNSLAARSSSLQHAERQVNIPATYRSRHRRHYALGISEKP
jgi:hypothetical protein